MGVQNGEIFTKLIDYKEQKYFEVYSIIVQLLHNEVVVVQPIIIQLKIEEDLPPSSTVESEYLLRHLSHKLAMEKIELSITKVVQNSYNMNTWFFNGIVDLLQKEFGLIVQTHKENYPFQS